MLTNDKQHLTIIIELFYFKNAIVKDLRGQGQMRVQRRSLRVQQEGGIDIFDIWKSKRNGSHGSMMHLFASFCSLEEVSLKIVCGSVMMEYQHIISNSDSS